jgi:hypothetical protein
VTGEDLRQLALTLRDLCEHTGASRATLSFGGTVVLYAVSAGVTVYPGSAEPVLISDEALDEIGLMPAAELVLTTAPNRNQA